MGGHGVVGGCVHAHQEGEGACVCTVCITLTVISFLRNGVITDYRWNLKEDLVVKAHKTNTAYYYKHQ